MNSSSCFEGRRKPAALVEVCSVRSGRLGLGTAVLIASGVILPNATTVHSEPAHEPRSEPTEEPQPVTQQSGVRLDAPATLAFGLETYAGVGVLANEDDNLAHGLAGALLRAKYGYAEVGAIVEWSDLRRGELRQERWRSIGGFAGAFLPFRKWIGIEAALGVVSRNYFNPDPHYGRNGYEIEMPALTLRLGISDRSSKRLLGANVGVGLAMGVDLKRPRVSWEYASTDRTYRVAGETVVGGITVAMVVTVGFDLATKLAWPTNANGGQVGTKPSAVRW
jgi:hypothetical protein